MYLLQLHSKQQSAMFMGDVSSHLHCPPYSTNNLYGARFAISWSGTLLLFSRSVKDCIKANAKSFIAIQKNSAILCGLLTTIQNSSTHHILVILFIIMWIIAFIYDVHHFGTQVTWIHTIADILGVFSR